MTNGHKRGCDLSEFDRGRIYGLKFDAKWTSQQIADKLAIPLSTVEKFCSRAKNQPNFQTSSRDSCGRKRKTTQTTDRQIKRLCLDNPFATAKEIKDNLADGEQLSEQTIRNRLDEAGLGCYIAATKTQLSQEHMKARFIWAKDKLPWTNEANWNHVIFSDESRFDLAGQVGTLVRRPIGTRFNLRHLKNKKNRATAHVMIWGAFSANGFTPLYRIQGNLNSVGYINLLKDHLLPAMGNLLPKGGLFQQDNAPIHVSKQTTTFLDNNDIQRIDWPALSPDMNPIENVWGILAKKTYWRKNFKF